MSFVRKLLAGSAATAVLLVPSAAAEARPRTPAPTVGYDVSYPQCGNALPDNPLFGIVGVSDGLAYGRNPCLAAEYTWASRAPQAPGFYMNTGNPGAASVRVDWYGQTGPEPCGTDNEAGCAYDYGYNGAAQAFDYAASQTGLDAAQAATWWLDVETSNSWSDDTSLNVADIQGSIDFLSGQVAGVGIYSTGYQWGRITGGVALDSSMSDWVAGAQSEKRAPALCASSFTGGAVALVQYPSAGADGDYPC